jgi:mRNA-degrading endonuclease RelE of RelBE toxin-antitoxin system
VNPERRLEITRRAARDLDALEKPQRAAISDAITRFAAGERNSDVRKLQGYDPPRWRLRVGRYRAILTLDGEVVVIERVLLRRDAYR